MSTQRIYPGMCDDSLEIFYHEEEDKLMAIQFGTIVDYDDLPQSSTDFLAKIIENDSELEIILNDWFPNNLNEQKKKLAKCRFGGLNYQADFNIKSGIIIHDRIDCNIKKVCNGCDIVCKNIKYYGEEITETDIRLTQLLSTDLKNLAIADQMKMPMGTFEVSRTKLYEKIRVRTKPELTRVGVYLGIC